MAVFTSILRAFRVIQSMPPADAPYGSSNVKNGDLSCDIYGALWVRTVAEPALTDAVAGKASLLSPLRIDYRAPNDTMSGIIASNVGALLTQFGGFNDSISDYYVQLFNQNSLPVDGDIPFQQFFVATGQSFVWNPSRVARAFYPPSTGISWAISVQKDKLETPGVYRSNFIYAEGYEGPP